MEYRQEEEGRILAAGRPTQSRGTCYHVGLLHPIFSDIIGQVSMAEPTLHRSHFPSRSGWSRCEGKDWLRPEQALTQYMLI